MLRNSFIFLNGVGTGLEEKIWKQLAARIHYQSLDFENPGAYADLQKRLDALDESVDAGGNRLFYMAVAPQHFASIVLQMHQHHMLDRNRGWKRLMIEKPFGHDLNSARALNQTLTRFFRENELFRIDHYLVKEMVQNLLTIRAANQIFEPTWNKDYIEHVEIISTESEGVGRRGAYYDQSGALRDMVQNHLLQLLALTAMELPQPLTEENLRKEKCRVLKSLVPMDGEDLTRHLVLGQYQRYREEANVAPESTTETFAALKVHLNQTRWQGVPFYLKTGKGLNEKNTRMTIQYRLPTGSCCLGSQVRTSHPNQLIIKIQPLEGVTLSFNTKQPGTANSIVPVTMDYCQSCLIETNTKEAYEKLLSDAMKGDRSSFTHWDEVEASWQWIDPITSWAEANPQVLRFYSKGSPGPLGPE